MKEPLLALVRADRSTDSMDLETPQLEGSLKKRSSKNVLIRTWHRRSFALSNGTLTYSKQGDPNPHGVFRCADIAAVVKGTVNPRGAGDFEVRFHDPATKTLHLWTDDPVELARWVGALTKAATAAKLAAAAHREAPAAVSKFGGGVERSAHYSPTSPLDVPAAQVLAGAPPSPRTALARGSFGGAFGVGQQLSPTVHGASVPRDLTCAVERFCVSCGDDDEARQPGGGDCHGFDAPPRTSAEPPQPYEQEPLRAVPVTPCGRGDEDSDWDESPGPSPPTRSVMAQVHRFGIVAPAQASAAAIPLSTADIDAGPSWLNYDDDDAPVRAPPIRRAPAAVPWTSPVSVPHTREPSADERNAVRPITPATPSSPPGCAIPAAKAAAIPAAAARRWSTAHDTMDDNFLDEDFDD